MHKLCPRLTRIRRSFTWKLRKSAKADQASKKKTALFVVRRRIDHKGRHFATEIDIHSKIIADVLNEIHAKTQRTKLKQSPPIVSPQSYLLMSSCFFVD